MPEFRAISTPMRDPEPSARANAGANNLGAAITALRRGEPVLIRDEMLNVLALAAELVTERKLRWLRGVSTAAPRVVLTRRRAVALGLAPRRDLSGALTISVSPEMPASVIRNLADPAASLGAEPPGFGPEPVVAKSGGLAAVTLGQARLAAARGFGCAGRHRGGRADGAPR